VPPDDRDRALAEARRWVRRKRIFATIVAIYLALSLMWFAIDLADDSTGPGRRDPAGGAARRA
jgi:hypothetical protein